MSLTRCCFPERAAAVGLAKEEEPEDALSAARARWVPRGRYLAQAYGFECGCTRCEVEAAIPDDDDTSDDDDEGGGNEEEEEPGLDEAMHEKDMALSVFLMRHLCEGCGGTLVPQPLRRAHACNMCGRARPDVLFELQLQAAMAEAGDSSEDEAEDGGASMVG